MLSKCETAQPFRSESVLRSFVRSILSVHSAFIFQQACFSSPYRLFFPLGGLYVPCNKVPLLPNLDVDDTSQSLDLKVPQTFPATPVNLPIYHCRTYVGGLCTLLRALSLRRLNPADASRDPLPRGRSRRRGIGFFNFNMLSFYIFTAFVVQRFPAEPPLCILRCH